MNDRLTDADLKELERRIVDGQSVDVLWVGPLLAEVREHRAARTRIPKKHVAALTEIADPASGYYSHHSAAARWVLSREKQP